MFLILSTFKNDKLFGKGLKLRPKRERLFKNRKGRQQDMIMNLIFQWDHKMICPYPKSHLEKNWSSNSTRTEQKKSQFQTMKVGGLRDIIPVSHVHESEGIWDPLSLLSYIPWNKPDKWVFLFVLTLHCVYKLTWMFKPPNLNGHLILCWNLRPQLRGFIECPIQQNCILFSKWLRNSIYKEVNIWMTPYMNTLYEMQ